MKNFLFFLAAGALFGVVAFFLNQEGDVRAKLVLAEQSYMEDVSIVQRREGVVKWMLSAKKAVFLPDDDVKLADLQIRFPEKDLILRSSDGIYNTESRNLKIDGEITASTKSYNIHAKTLFWDAKKNEIVSDQPIQIVGQGFTVDGDDLVATTDRAKLQNNVRAVFNGKK